MNVNFTATLRQHVCRSVFILTNEEGVAGTCVDFRKGELVGALDCRKRNSVFNFRLHSLKITTRYLLVNGGCSHYSIISHYPGCPHYPYYCF